MREDDDVERTEAVRGSVQPKRARPQPRAMTEADLHVFDALGAMVVVLDVDDRIVHWNNAATDVTGYSLEEARGRRPAEFLMLSDEHDPGANYWTTKAGHRRWIIWSNALVEGSDGAPSYVIKTGIDDTEGRRQTEDANAARERSERSEQELRQVAEFRERFIGILGHDLRNPLSAIHMTATALLRSCRLDEEDGQRVARILKSSQRMTRMISQLLDLTRARLGGGFPLEAKLTDLGDVCRGVVDEFGAAIELRVEGDLTGTWDPDRLAEVVSNITGNALEHATPGTRVVVLARADETDAVVEISNEGAPISADLLPFIFEAYRQAQPGERAAGNLGLGLYIAHQIVLATGGTLDARSSAGRTTFVARLPRKRPAAAKTKGDASSLTSAAAAP